MSSSWRKGERRARSLTVKTVYPSPLSNEWDSRRKKERRKKKLQQWARRGFLTAAHRENQASPNEHSPKATRPKLYYSATGTRFIYPPTHKTGKVKAERGGRGKNVRWAELSRAAGSEEGLISYRTAKKSCKTDERTREKTKSIGEQQQLLTRSQEIGSVVAS